MTISIRPELEVMLRKRAEVEGVTVEVLIESLLLSEKRALDEIEELALEGLRSGDAFEPGPEFWEERHRLLDERLRGGR